MAYQKGTQQTIPFTLYSGSTPTVPSNTPTGTIYSEFGSTGMTYIPTHDGNGIYHVILTAAETANDWASLRFIATGTDIRHLDLVFESDWTPTRAAYLDEAISAPKNLTATAIDGIYAHNVQSYDATGTSAGSAMKAAWAQGFGKWTIVGTTLTLYGPDGTTPVRTFALSNAVYPTARTPS